MRKCRYLRTQHYIIITHDRAGPDREFRRCHAPGPPRCPLRHVLHCHGGPWRVVNVFVPSTARNTSRRRTVSPPASEVASCSMVALQALGCSVHVVRAHESGIAHLSLLLYIAASISLSLPFSSPLYRATRTCSMRAMRYVCFLSLRCRHGYGCAIQGAVRLRRGCRCCCACRMRTWWWRKLGAWLCPLAVGRPMI